MGVPPPPPGIEIAIKRGFYMICNGLPPSEAVCVGLIADNRKYRGKVLPFKSEAIADKRTPDRLRSEEKKDRTCFQVWLDVFQGE